MGNLEIFKIDLKGLKGDEVTCEYSLDDDYFEAIGATQVNGGSFHTTLKVKKTAGAFELLFHSSGTAIVSCDKCLENMDLPIETTNRVVVRLGEEYSDDDDMITVPDDEGIIDVAWLIYEFIALSIPSRHVHEEGLCNPEMVSKLESLSAQKATSIDAVDPRWSVLENLKSTIK